MASIENISVDGFKNLFSRTFSSYFLPIWVSGTYYMKDDVVFYNNKFYQSQIDYNNTVPDHQNSDGGVNPPSSVLPGLTYEYIGE